MKVIVLRFVRILEDVACGADRWFQCYPHSKCQFFACLSLIFCEKTHNRKLQSRWHHCQMQNHQFSKPDETVRFSLLRCVCGCLEFASHFFQTGVLQSFFFGWHWGKLMTNRTTKVPIQEYNQFCFLLLILQLCFL